MKLLLCKNIAKLGIVGDIVEVAPGYGRNYLVPGGLATEPTQTNIRALAEARKTAELEREHQRTELEQLAERLKEVEVMIRARANESGVLYGSVGRHEIAAALAEEGYYVHDEQVALAQPIRQLDNIEVPIKLADDLMTAIKVWVVPEKTEESEDEQSPELETETQTAVRPQAGSNDRDTGGE